jgi:hypothetical protein
MRANLSRSRRRHISRMIRRRGPDFGDLSPDAQLLYVVGALVCDDAGIVKKVDLEPAMKDPAIIAVARDILTQERAHLAGGGS